MQLNSFLQNLLELLVDATVRLVSSWMKLVIDVCFSTSFSDFTGDLIADCSNNLSDFDWVLKSNRFKIVILLIVHLESSINLRKKE